MRTPHVAAAILVALLPSSLGTFDAHACGMFMGPRDPTLGVPAISTEQVLIVHDADKGREHFVREVRFANVRGKLGFVVPVPAVPEIAKEAAPFEALSAAFPFQPPLPKRRGVPGGRGFGKGAIPAAAGIGGDGEGAGPPPVEVLATKKVGSFTAFTLSARDPDAFRAWLTSNGLEAPPENQKWLAHYVKLGFFFVALRFDGADQELVSETVRISFDTPVPFYPYLEPEASPDKERGGRQRLLRSWVVTSAPVSPVAVRTGRGGMSSLLRISPVVPWGVGTEYGDRAAITRALGKDLAKRVPQTAVLQTYADMRVSRNGYGDILFVPRAKGSPSPEARKKWEPLLPLLDPTLLEGDELVSVAR